MEPLQFLSETIIETLKEFSSTKSPLSAGSLCAALSERKEICALINESSQIAKEVADGPTNTFGRISVKTSMPVRQPDLSQALRQVLDIFDMILTAMDRIAQDEDLQHSTELRQRLQSCHTVESLVLESGEIVNMVNSVVNGAAEQIDIANEFLEELSENISTMGKQLVDYQSHNRETFMLQDQFCEGLLSRTREMDQAVTFAQALKDVRDIISSRLSTIGNAIETRREENEERIKEADSKIAELQMSVRSYNEQIDKVTQRARELEKEILLDPLLQINNRRSYDLEILKRLADYQRTQRPFSVILIDVDHFKEINDQFGHRAGDKCLQVLAKRLANCVRKTDFLARYGGEELVVVVPDTNAQQAKVISEKIRECIDRTRFYYNDQPIRLTISLGVTEARPVDIDADKLFVRVDEAMYHAKRGGRNRVVVV